MNVIFDFIFMGPVELEGTQESEKYKLKTSCTQWDSRTQTSDFVV